MPNDFTCGTTTAAGAQKRAIAEEYQRQTGGAK